VKDPAMGKNQPSRVAVLTPLPPSKTGVAHYASMLLPALTAALEARSGSVIAVADPASLDATGVTHAIYQLGNNPFHEPMYAEAMRRPGIIVLHDLVLHHLVVEMTLARGDAAGYVASLEASHGAAGAAWARGRAAGLHSEMGNFLLPGSIEIAQRSLAVIVHNQYAAERLRSFGVRTPIHVVPHPYVPEVRTFDRTALRARHGLSESHRVIGFFGFLTSAKRSEVVLEAFRIARERDPRLVLLIVGEPSPNMNLEALAADGIVTTGYVADEDFSSYYAVADRLVNLRYPSAGETSGTLIRAFDAGKPVAVSDYAQFAEFPDSCVVKVPLGEGEVARLIAFFTEDLPDPATAQRAWLEQNASLSRTVAGYLDVIDSVSQPQRIEERSPAIAGSIPLFPRLTVLEADASVRFIVRNDGPATIYTRTYGQPEYRLIARLFAGEQYVQDQWLALPCDLRPGETAELTFPARSHATTLRLYHALQDIPMLEPEAWGSFDVR
jgi:glycosyltransferase involved in cell wall biosynthesis